MNRSGVILSSIVGWLLIVFFSFGITKASALDNNTDVEWESNIHLQNYNEILDIKPTSDGGYIIAGNTASTPKNTDVFVRRIDSNGQEVWTEIYKDELSEKSASIQETKDGGFLLLGTSENNDEYKYSMFLININQNGNMNWKKEVELKGDNWASSLELTEDGGFIITGHSYDDDDTDNGYDIQLIKTDSLGNEEWQKVFHELGTQMGYKGKQTSDGGYIVTGTSARDFYILKVDSTGKKVWDKTLVDSSVSYDSRGNDLVETKDKGFVITGNIQLDSNYPYLIKLSKTGEKVWEYTYDYKGWGRSIAKSDDGGFLITGFCVNPESFERKIYVLKVNSVGQKLWSKTLDSDTWANKLEITKDHGIVVAGGKGKFNYGSFSTSDAYVAKINLDKEKKTTKLVASTKSVKLDLPKKRTASITLKAVYDDGTTENVTEMAEWTPNYISIVDVEKGEIRAKNKGTVTIEAKYGGKKVLLSVKVSGNAPTINWDSIVGEAATDKADIIRKTKDGGYIVAGISTSYKDFIGNVILKVNKSGKTEWITPLDISSPDYFDVRETNDSNIIGVFGSKVALLNSKGRLQWKRDLDGTYNRIQPTEDKGYILTGTKKEDIVITKLDSNGTKKWTSTIDKEEYDRGVDIKEISNGYILLGNISSYTSRNKMYVAQINKSGELIWEKSYIGLLGKFIEVTQNGDFLIMGSGKGSFVMALDQNGNVKWDKTFPFVSESFCKTKNDGFLLIGYHGQSTRIIKADNMGKQMWEVYLGDKIRANDILETSSDKYVLAGEIDSSYGHGSSDFFILMFSH